MCLPETTKDFLKTVRKGILAPEWMKNEEWFNVTNHIAEFRCTVSMLPLFITGFLWIREQPLCGCLCLLAASASSLYHTMPLDFLLRFDQFFATLLILYILFGYPVIEHPHLMLLYGVTFLIMVVDTLSRFWNTRWRIPYIHPLWHVMGAVCVYSSLISI